MLFIGAATSSFIMLNVTDPGTRSKASAAMKSRHPAFSDKAVRDRDGLLIDRKGIQEVIYGRRAFVTANFLNNPPRFRSPNTKFEFNIDKANQLLEAAGWKKGADGIRAKGNQEAQFVYQTSVSQPRQKCQAIIKDACGQGRHRPRAQERGRGGVFGSATSPIPTPTRSSGRIADVHHHDGQPDPQFFMEQWTTDQIAQKSNKLGQPQPGALEQCRVRRRVQGGAGRVRSGQARGHVHQDERPGRQRWQRDPAVRPSAATASSTSWCPRCPPGTTPPGPSALVPGRLMH